MTGADARLLKLCVASGLLTEERAAAAEREARDGGIPLRIALLRDGMPPDVLASLERAALAGSSAAGAAPTMVGIASGAEPPIMGSVVGSEPAPSTLSLTSSPHFGKYELLGEIGRGGMGVVYKARHPGLDRIVALKTLLAAGPEEITARFLREARTTAKLGKHPNLVQIHDVDEADGAPFIVMDFVEGRSFEREIADSRPTPRRAAEVVEQIARGLAVAHAEGIIHRDLKPANILIDRTGKPLVTDFGLARDVSVPGLSVYGQVLGTPAYMSPEQAEGRPERVDERADVYGLGAILYEALAGRPPLTAEGIVELLRKVSEEDPVPPSRFNSAVPPELDIVALKCLAKRREERYESAAALADDLRRWLTGEGILARPLPFAKRLARRARRHAVALSLAAVAVALFSWGIVAGLHAHREGIDRKRQAEGAEAARRESETRSRRSADRLRRGRTSLEEAEAALRIDPSGGVIAKVPEDFLESTVGDFRAALADTPDDFEANLLLARALRLRFELRDAWIQAGRALALRPDDTAALYERTLVGLKLFESSLGHGLAITSDSTPQLGRISRVVIYVKKDPEAADFRVTARRDIERLSRAGLAEAPAAYCRAVLAHIDGDSHTALEELDRAVAADPYFLDAHRLRARVLCVLKSPEAPAACRRFLAVRPEDRTLWIDLAQREPKIEDSLADIDRAAALEDDPAFFDALRATRLNYVDRNAEAAAVAERAIAANPRLPLAHNVMYLVALSRGDWPRAHRALDEWQAADPDSVYAVTNRAFLLYSAGRHAESLPIFKKASDVSGNYPVYRYCLGRARVLTGDYVEGASDMLEAVAGGDLDEKARATLDKQKAGVVKRAAALKSPVEAGKFLEGLATLMMLALSPDAPPERRAQYEGSMRTMRDLAAELHEQGQSWKHARELFKLVSAGDPIRWNYPFRLARIDAKREKFAESAAELREARDKGMDRPGAIELDERFAAFRASPEWEALRKEFDAPR
ncbi:MAG: protein kinase [Planctomycetes bacterium]|nr:protein kinase [Planctomycetota bacterium]